MGPLFTVNGTDGGRYATGATDRDAADAKGLARKAR